MCDACQYKQYCDDCKEEQEPIEVIASDCNNVVTPKINNVLVEGGYLYHKGRAFHIHGKMTNKQMSQKSIIQTAEGFLFHIRDLGDKLIVTKIIRTKPKNGGRPDCPECQKIFIGKIPSELLVDSNW